VLATHFIAEIRRGFRLNRRGTASKVAQPALFAARKLFLRNFFARAIKQFPGLFRICMTESVDINRA
jgi:hypothetical protein